MSERAEKDPESTQEEPFFLSMLPFAGLLLLLVVALLWRFVPRGGPERPPEQDRGKLVVERWAREDRREIPVEASDFTLGPDDAPVTIVEFSDFECPYCRAGAEAAKEVLDRYPDKVRLVFKNLPLDTACNEAMQQQLHPHACRAAVLARCAGERDEARFWDAHDALFRAPRLSGEVLEKIPEELSLSTAELEACMASETPMEKVKQDLAQARRLGVSSTPAFFLNGRQVSDYRDGLLGRVVEHVLSKPGEL